MHNPNLKPQKTRWYSTFVRGILTAALIVGTLGAGVITAAPASAAPSDLVITLTDSTFTTPNTYTNPSTPQTLTSTSKEIYFTIKNNSPSGGSVFTNLDLSLHSSVSGIQHLEPVNAYYLSCSINFGAVTQYYGLVNRGSSFVTVNPRVDSTSGRVFENGAATATQLHGGNELRCTATIFSNTKNSPNATDLAPGDLVSTTIKLEAVETNAPATVLTYKTPTQWGLVPPTVPMDYEIVKWICTDGVPANCDTNDPTDWAYKWDEVPTTGNPQPTYKVTIHNRGTSKLCDVYAWRDKANSGFGTVPAPHADTTLAEPGFPNAVHELEVGQYETFTYSELDFSNVNHISLVTANVCPGMTPSFKEDSVTASSNNLPAPNIVTNKVFDNPAQSIVAPGVPQTISYTITVTNTGDAEWTGGAVRDPLNGTLTYVSSSPTATVTGTTNKTVNWTSGALQPGQSNTFHVTVNQAALPAGATINNCAIVGAWAPETCATIFVRSATVVQNKVANVTTAQPGDNITYTITYAKTGNGSVPANVVRDTLPAGLTYVSSTPAGATVSGQDVSWNAAAFGGSALTRTYTVTAKVDAGFSGTLVNPVKLVTPQPTTPAITFTVNNPCTDDATASCATTTVTIPAVEVTPTAPTVVVSAVCGIGATVNIPTQTGVTYTNSNPSATEGLVTITATANSGYIFPTDAITSWELDLGEIEPCDIEVTPISPQMVLSTVCGVGATINIPTQTGVSYINDNPGQTVGTITIRAVANDGYVIPLGTVNAWQFDLPAIVPCDVEVTPVAPVIVPAATCGVGATITIPTVEGVTYTNNNPSATEGNVTITATANDGYVFANGAITSWVLDLGEIEACDIEVTPSTPTVEPAATCGVGATVVLPTVTGITYTNSSPSATSGLVTITATANSGYVIADGATTSWVLDLGEIEACDDVVTPVVPTVVPSAVCGVGATVQMPSLEGVTYSSSDSTATEGNVTITATANTGYTFPAGAVTSWVLDLGTIEPCDEVITPEAPTATLSTVCGIGGTYAVPTQDGVTYTVGNPDATEGVITITATANDGYVFASGVVTSWELDLGQIVACDEIVTPSAPSVIISDVCNVGSKVVITPTTGVTYINSNPDATEGTVTITATADEGYVFASNAITSWTLDLGTIVDCVEVTPVTPRMILSSGAQNENCYVIEVEDTEGVEYTIGEEVNTEGKTVVTATPKTGFIIPDNATTEWAFNLACEDKPVVPTKPTPAGNGGDKLAVTGDGGVLPLVGGATLLFLMLGTGALLARRRMANQDS